MSNPVVRNLKIKAGVVKRLAKEKISYIQEAENQKIRINKFKEEGKDESFIKKQYEVLQESLIMIPDCQRRLLNAYGELRALVESEKDLCKCEEYENAIKILEEVKPEIETQ